MKQDRALGIFLSLASITIIVSLLVGVYLQSSLAFNELRFQPLALIPLAGLVVDIFLLSLIIKRQASIPGSFWFATFMASMVLWSASDILSFSNAAPQIAVLTRSVIMIPGLLGLPAILMFVLIITKHKSQEMTGSWVGVYSASALLLFFGLATNLIFDKQPAHLLTAFWGKEVPLGPLVNIYLAWSEILLLLTASIVIRYYFKQKDVIERKKARLIAIAFIIPILGTSATSIVLPALNIVFIPINSIYITIMASMTLYGLRKYNLFVINPATVATSILETMAETVIVTNAKFELQYANASAEKVTGISSSNDPHTRIDKLFSAEHFGRIRQHLLADPKLHTSQKFDDLAIIGQHTHAVTPVDLSVSSVLDHDAKLVGYIFVMADISALKHAYAQLAQEEQIVEQKVLERNEELFTEHAKLEASIASLPIGFIMLDEKSRILELNGVAKDLLELRGNARSHLENSFDKLGISEKLKGVKSTKELADIPEIKFGRKILHVILTPIVGNNHSEGIGIVILIEDITKQKIAERERNEFIVTASHEMRTPLAIVQGNLSNALDPDIAKLSSDARPMVQQAYDSAKQLSELFKDIMTVSEIDNNDAPHYENKTAFGLTAILKECIDLQRSKADTRKLALSLAGNDLDLTAEGDPNEVREIVQKLIENAIKYTPKGFVSVELKFSNNKAIVSVEDSGIGIEPSDRRRLFKKFARLDNKLTRTIGGTGLGLYIAHNLAKRNGGDLVLEHSSKKGSIFTFSVPAKLTKDIAKPQL